VAGVTLDTTGIRGRAASRQPRPPQTFDRRLHERRVERPGHWQRYHAHRPGLHASSTIRSQAACGRKPRCCPGIAGWPLPAFHRRRQGAERFHFLRAPCPDAHHAAAGRVGASCMPGHAPAPRADRVEIHHAANTSACTHRGSGPRPRHAVDQLGRILLELLQRARLATNRAGWLQAVVSSSSAGPCVQSSSRS